jgi:quercetin dioxygenase-like cupin family protein
VCSKLDVTLLRPLLSNEGRGKEKPMLEVILKRFEQPDEIRTLEKGRFELVRLGGMTIGRATYEPGWKWSEHVGRAAGAKSCTVEHVGMVVSGRATAAMDDGQLIEMKAGDVFYIAPGHDSWVVG